MAISARTARRLAAARDIAAVLAFCALVFLGGRALFDSPYLQKERLTKGEAARDISEFFAAAGGTGQAAGPAAQADALSQAEGKLDEFGRITVRDLAWILYRSAAAFENPAVRLLWQPPHKWKDPELKFPPFTLDYRQGKFVVDAPAGQAPAGSELASLNGVPFKDLIAPVLERVAADNPRARAASFCADQYFWWNFSGLLSGKTYLAAELRAPDGKTYREKTGLISGWEFRRLSGSPAPQNGRFYVLRGTAWVDVPDMEYSRAWRGAYADIFKKIRKQNEASLVLDLRRNSGSDPRAAAFLLSLLAPADGSQGTVRIEVLIGPGTTGAAALFAARFKAMKLGELVGEETGTPPDGFFIPGTRKLSNSAIPFSVPASRYAGGIPGPAVAPDLPLTAALLAPHKGDVRAFVLARIAKEKGRKK